jgi:asparagine synthase (glutamine-hydrolysing)
MKIFGKFDKNTTIHLPFESSNLNKPFNNSEKFSWKTFSKNGIELFFSGIIYNSAELFTDFNKENITENLLDLFLREDFYGFKKINGKATIVVKTTSKVLIYRDHWGEGPLIYYSKYGFSDSMEGVLESYSDPICVDKVSLNCFFRYGFIPAPLTIIEAVSKVPAGYVLVRTQNENQLFNLFDFDEFKSKTIKIEMDEAVEEYGRLLKNSMRRRIGSAETVGTLLSGGYDSGGNIAVLREVFDGQIKSYSIGFRDNPFSELPYAKLMADEFGAEHHEYLMDHNDIESLPQAVQAFGEPFSESGFMLNNQAMRLVSTENLPVIIGGDGNDQLMGTTGKELALHHLSKTFGVIHLQNLFSKISNNSLFENDNILFKLRFHNQKILNVMKPDNFGFNDFMMKSLFNMGNIAEHPAFLSKFKNYKDFSEFHDLHNYHMDIRHSINEVIINKASRLSSFYGIHLSFSYMDNEIYDFIKTLPLDLRLKGSIYDIAKGKGTTKYIHKFYTKPKLPSDVTSRKKQGGFSPLSIFFAKKETREKIYSYIEKSGFISQFVNLSDLKLFFNHYEIISAKPGYWFWFQQLKSNQLINLLIMSLWWDIYINKRKFDSLSDYLKF